MNLLHSPLHEWHINNNATMTTAASDGEMPLHYSSGIVAEHLHTRSVASLFDFSHMGKLLLLGKKASQSLSLAITANLSTLHPGRCRYAFFLHKQGGIKDDFIVYRLAEESYFLVMNPATYQRNSKEIAEMMPPSVLCEDISQKTVKFDLQGPASFSVLDATLEGTWRRLPYYGFVQTTFEGEPLLVSRTGFTGELGVELYCPVAQAKQLWHLLIKHESVLPAGLGARNTLRLEVGLPVYGLDLDEDHTPAEAGFAGLLNAQAPYQGKEHAHTLHEKLIPLLFADENYAHTGDIVFSADNVPVGRITSSLLSPSLNVGIAFAYIKVAHAKSLKYLVKTQNGLHEVALATLPFYTKGTARNPLL